MPMSWQKWIAIITGDHDCESEGFDTLMQAYYYIMQNNYCVNQLVCKQSSMKL
jgi:hypothetical protein